MKQGSKNNFFKTYRILSLVGRVALMGVLMTATTRCGKGDDDVSSPESMSEVGSAALSGALASSEGDGSLAYQGKSASPSFLQNLGRMLAPIPEAHAASCNRACPTLLQPGAATCGSDNSVTFNYDGCSFARNQGEDCSPAQWFGSQNILFSNPPACTLPMGFPLPVGASLTRTVSGGLITEAEAGNPPSAATYRVGPFGGRVFIDTSDGTGWDPSISPKVSGGKLIEWTSNAPVSRRITIKGVNYDAFLERPRRHDWKEVWNHTIDTPVPVVVQGVGANRVVVSGTIRVQHNILHCTGNIQLNNIAYSLTDCPHPSSGSFTTTITCESGATRTETLSFEATACGDAKFNGKAISLSNVF